MDSSACQTLVTHAQVDSASPQSERPATGQVGAWALLQPLQRLAWGFSLNDRLSEDSPVVYLFECMTLAKIVGAIAGWSAQPYMQQQALEKRMLAQGLAWRDSAPWFETQAAHPRLAKGHMKDADVLQASQYLLQPKSHLRNRVPLWSYSQRNLVELPL